MNHWSEEKRKVTSGDTQYLKKNLELESKLKKANDIFFEYKVKNFPLDIELFDKHFKDTEKEKSHQLPLTKANPGAEKHHPSCRTKVL
ncbi:MAG: hypothetical protein ACOCX0_06040, partial [Bacteroidota bacterium]